MKNDKLVIPAEALEPEENQIELFPDQTRYEVTLTGKGYLRRKAHCKKHEVFIGKKVTIAKNHLIPIK